MGGWVCWRGPAGRLAGDVCAWSAPATLVLVLVAGRAQAQGAPLAQLDEVRGMVSGDACAPSPRKGTRNSLSRVRGGQTEPAWPRDLVLPRDRMLVQPLTDVRLRVDQRIGRGSIYLAPELGRCVAAASALRAQGIAVPPGGSGTYRFTIDSVRRVGVTRERLLLTVENGGVVVEWDSGELSVFALGREVQRAGTVLAVFVNAAAQRATVYVLEGAVLIGTVRAVPGEGLSFGPTGPIVRHTGLGQGFVSDVQYHGTTNGRTVWTTPIRSGFPWKWVGLGAVAGGVGYFACCNSNPDPPRRPFQGTIVIRIPL